jgi:preprotein translocase SecE subunit
MSRAMRRQGPLINKPPAKQPGFKPAGSRAPKQQVSAEAVAEAKKKRTFFERIPFFGRSIQDIASELKKVTWPTREEVTRLTMAVLAVSIVMGLLLGGVDFGFNWLVDNTLLRN